MNSTADASSHLAVPALAPAARLSALSPRLIGALPVTILLVAAVLALIIINLAELALPLSTDQALYSFIGHEIRQGYLPYRDFPDLKPPGIFYTRALLDGLVGAAWTGQCLPGPLHASCGWVVVKAADVVTTALLGLGLYGLARRLRLPGGAALTAAALGAVYVSLTYVSQLGLSPEKLAASGTTLALLLGARARGIGGWLAAGLAAGAAVLMKQPAGTVMVPLAFLVVLDVQSSRARALRLAALGLGFAAPLALVAAYFASQHALAALVQYTLSINLERIRTDASLGGFGGDNAAQAAWQAFKSGLAPFWLLGVVGVLSAGYLPRPARAILLAWLATDAALLLRLREYVQLAPSIALLGGWGAWRVWRAAGQPPFIGLAGAVSARVLLATSLVSLFLLSSAFEESVVMRVVNDRGIHSFVFSPDEFVADELRKLPAGSLFVWGNGAELYVLSGRQPAASNLNVVPLSANLSGAADRRAHLISELQASRPVLVAVSPEVNRAGKGLSLEGFPQLKKLLDSAYAPVQNISQDPKFGGWRVYLARAANAP